jgi:hypothetical protein
MFIKEKHNKSKKYLDFVRFSFVFQYRFDHQAKKLR